jgi:two-component system, cell cycle sensor histidine kinase and response regulator CckA
VHPSIKDLGVDIAGTIREPFLILDGNLAVVAANKPFYRAFAAGEKETVGKRIYDLGNGQWNIPDLRTLLEEVLPDNAFFEGFEVDHAFPDIGRQTMSLNARRLSREEGHAELIFLAFENVTERRKAESYRRLFEAAYDGILIMDLGNGKITDTNAYLPALLGCGKEDLLGKELWEIGLFENEAAGRYVFKKLAAEGKIRFDDLPVKLKDGRQLDVELVCSSYAIGQENVIQCSLRDVTYRKTAEKALRQSEKQLRQSQKMESVGKLAGGIAHEFNNLLTAINGYNALALAMVDPKDVLHGYLDEIQKAGDRAATLTSQLLAYGRKQMLAPKRVNANAIIKGMSNIFNMVIREGIVLDYDLAPDLGTVNMDAGQLEQVLINLVVNAREAIPGNGRIIIETRNVELDEAYAILHPSVLPGSFALLCVSDTGCGMEEDVKTQVFEPFYTTKGLAVSKGLGLSFVHGVISQSGGHVFAYSEPGMGATFKIYLPLAPDPADGRHAPDGAGLTGSETILVVEHEDMIREYARKILETQGYRVLVAEDGEKALTLLEGKREPIHLLITDVFMPGMNGKVLADRVTQRDSGIRVLYMSGYPDEIILHHGLLEKDANFLQKPFSTWRLSKTVREVLDAKIAALASEG